MSHRLRSPRMWVGVSCVASETRVLTSAVHAPAAYCGSVLNEFNVHYMIRICNLAHFIKWTLGPRPLANPRNKNG